MGSIAQYVPFINTLGFIAVAAAILYTQFRSGSKQINAEVLANYKALDEQKTQQLVSYEKDIAEIKANMRSMEKAFIERISKMEGQLKEKDNQIANLNQILSNRNPDLERILTEIHEFMKHLTQTNLHQNEMLEGQVLRDREQDLATDQGTGNPIRGGTNLNKK